MSVKVTIHGLRPSGVCSLSGKDGEVLVVTFEDGTVREGALSPKSLLQLLRMKLASAAQNPTAKAELKSAVPVTLPATVPVGAPK